MNNLDMIEIRNYVTKDGKSILQYRFKYPALMHSAHAYPPEKWWLSEWKDVKTEHEIVYFKGVI